MAQAFEITLYFEGNPTFHSYYKYGPTPDDPTDHWYEFLYDGQTGAELLSDRIILHFVDGERGDSDLSINGAISDPGGPVEITEAEVTIVKQVTGDTPDDWSFAFTGDLGPFDLSDDTFVAVAGGLTPGDFDLTETNPPGWVTTSSCYPGGETGNESISVNLVGGQWGACYFVNTICFMGTYDDGSACVDAAAGHYTDTAGAADDIPCAPGSYQPSEGQPGCFLADADHYATGPAATAQTACPGGTTSPEGSDSIDDCVGVPPTTADLTIDKVVNGSGAPADWSFGFTGDLGSFSLTDDVFVAAAPDLAPDEYAVSETNPAGYATSASCNNGDSSTDGSLSVTLDAGDDVECTFTNTICQPGSFDSASTWACAPAAAGYFVAATGASTQTACAPGYYQPATGAAACIPAAAGYYVPGTAATAQQACAPGRYQSASGASACIPASAGFYATGPAATAQTACPSGTTSPPGSDSIADCTATASTAIYMSAATAGTTGDGLAFGSEDILMWDGNEWALAFDGSAANLVARKAVHNINAFHYGGSADITLAFAQNRRYVPDIPFPIDGMDLVRWNGSSFSFHFDGSDVGLTQLTQEKIDGLHVLPGSAAPQALKNAAGGSCQSYLLISTVGPGKVPNLGGGSINFSGEDVLGFCATQLGTTTAGKWMMVLDGSAQGMPKNSTDSISTNADGTVIYLTTRGLFTVFGVTGGHSEVYAYNTTSHAFSGPLFSANSFGLAAKVDGLQYDVNP